MKEREERTVCLENEDPEVHQASGVLPVLQVLVLKVTRDLKEPQVTKDHLVAVVNLAHMACRVKTAHQAHLDPKARWEKPGSPDLLV